MALGSEQDEDLGGFRPGSGSPSQLHRGDLDLPGDLDPEDRAPDTMMVRVGEVWDVAVVGAGPAGSAAALGALLRRPDARVLLLDRSDFPRDKSCGDGIAPHVVDVVRALGAPDPTEGFAPVHRLHLVGPRGGAVVRTMRRPTKVVPRTVLDSRLASAAVAAGAVLRRHTVRSVEQRADLVVLDGTIAARAVVGADGVNGVVRRCLGLAPNPPRAMAVALRAYAATPLGHEHEQYMIMSGTGWPAYAWSFPIGDGTANVGYGMVLEAATASRSRLEAELYRLLPALGEIRNARAHRLPLSTARPRQPDGRVVLAGDAASLINPFTGEGIFYAVRSGSVAGIAALRGAAAGRVVRTTLQRRLGAHFRATGMVALLGRSQSVVDAGIRAAGRDQMIFDDLVEVGLAEGRLTAAALARTAGQLVRRTG